MEFAVGAAVLSVPYLLKKFTDRPFPFPDPHGCYPKIGVKDIRIGPRLRARVFYPCEDDAPIVPTPYFRDGIAGPRGVMRFFRKLPTYTMDFMARSRVYFCGEAPMRKIPEKMPLLVYHHGLGGSADVGTLFFCQMASRGFVVLAVETSCGAASRTVLANGEVLEYLHVPPEYKGIHPPPQFCREFRGPQLRFRMELFQTELLPYLIHGEKDYTDANSPGTDCRPDGGMPQNVFDRIDRSNIILGGHSFGGSTTIAILDWWLIGGGRAQYHTSTGLDFIASILHDPWFEIFEEEYVEKLLLRIHNLVPAGSDEHTPGFAEGRWVPTFVLNSEYWDIWKEHLWFERKFLQSITASREEAIALRIALDERVSEVLRGYGNCKHSKSICEKNNENSNNVETPCISENMDLFSFGDCEHEAAPFNPMLAASSIKKRISRLSMPDQQIPENFLLNGRISSSSSYKTTESYWLEEELLSLEERRQIYEQVVAPPKSSTKCTIIGVKRSSHYSFVDAPYWFTWFSKPFSSSIRRAIPPPEFTAIQAALSSQFIAQNIGHVLDNSGHRLENISVESKLRYVDCLGESKVNDKYMDGMDWCLWALDWQLRPGSLSCPSGLSLAKLTKSDDLNGVNPSNLLPRLHDSFLIRCPIPCGASMPKIIRGIDEDEEETAYLNSILKKKPIDLTEEETGIGGSGEDEDDSDNSQKMVFKTECEIRAMVDQSEVEEGRIKRLLGYLTSWVHKKHTSSNSSNTTRCNLEQKSLSDMKEQCEGEDHQAKHQQLQQPAVLLLKKVEDENTSHQSYSSNASSNQSSSRGNNMIDINITAAHAEDAGRMNLDADSPTSSISKHLEQSPPIHTHKNDSSLDNNRGALSLKNGELSTVAPSPISLNSASANNGRFGLNGTENSISVIDGDNVGSNSSFDCQHESDNEMRDREQNSRD